MNYLTLEEIHKHLNIDSEFTDDDVYLEALGDAAEEVVSKYINEDFAEFEDEDGNIPKSLKFAMLVWIASAYAVRESVSTSAMSSVPHSFEMLCDLYRNYVKNN